LSFIAIIFILNGKNNLCAVSIRPLATKKATLFLLATPATKNVFLKPLESPYQPLIYLREKAPLER